jgi:glycosyltransferase involved in cell wall biosynthesis
MRIAVVETSRYGGLLHYAFQLASGLATDGHQVDLLVPRGHELAAEAPTTAMQGSLAVRALLTPPDQQDRPPPRARWRYLLRRGLIAGRLAASCARILRQVRRDRYDAVVLQWGLPFPVFTQATRILLRRRSRPVVGYVLHNVMPFNAGPGEHLHKDDAASMRTLSALLPQFDVVFVHGRRSLELCRELWPETEVTVIPFGIQKVFQDSEVATETGEQILFFGDWRKVKGLPVLMDAFDLLVGRCPQARLTIAGAPAPADFDDRRVREWAGGHGKRVTLVPRYVPMADVPALFGSARAVVLPYLTASQSGVAHLAMTFGRPVVASDVGDLPEVVIDGTNGLIVPPGDPAALALALERLLTEPALAEQMGRAGQQRARDDADWQSVGGRIAGALADAQSKRSHTRRAT